MEEISKLKMGLPARRRAPSTRRADAEPDLFESLPPEPVVASLSSLVPLWIEVAAPSSLAMAHSSGISLDFITWGSGVRLGRTSATWCEAPGGVDLVCVLFGAAAWQCAPRDRWIGWSGEQRAQRLALSANNSRFLLLPHVRVPGLANHILWRIARRLDADWQQRYRHRIHLLESFVQPDRFRGTCYQAANWIRIGQTTGRTRQSQRHRDNEVHAPVKDVYLYPLSSDARQQLCR